MFMSLELDRTNLGQAVSDDFLTDLNMSTDGEELSRPPTPTIVILNF
jgi:hypothetical protein